MEYLVFPFGKYKGEKLEDLPSTYIVLALEKFELPDELKDRLLFIIHSRLGIHDLILKASCFGEDPDYEKAYGKLTSYAYDIVDFISINYKNK